MHKSWYDQKKCTTSWSLAENSTKKKKTLEEKKTFQQRKKVLEYKCEDPLKDERDNFWHKVDDEVSEKCNIFL